MTDRLKNKRRLNFGLRELLGGISILAIAFACERQSFGFGAAWAAMVVGGMSVFFVRGKKDLLIALLIGGLVFTVLLGAALLWDTQRYEETYPEKHSMFGPLWIGVLMAGIEVGALIAFVGFAFVKFWHFALTRPLQFEIDHSEDQPIDSNEDG